MQSNDPFNDVIEDLDDAAMPRPPARINWLVCLMALLAGLVVGGAAGVKASGVSFSMGGGGWLHDLDDGLDEMEATGKPLLVFYTADWCPPCQQLKKDVLSDADVQAYLADAFVRVKVDLTDRFGPNLDLAREYDVSGIPTMIVYDPGGREVQRLVGGEVGAWIMEQVRW